jgi:GTP pyrophosphokinase
MGKRIASVVAKRLVMLLYELGEKPDPVLLSRARFAAEEEGQEPNQQGLIIDGSETTVVFFEPCCWPIPGERIIGYLGQGEGVHIHTLHCRTATKLRKRNAENFITAAWADEPVRHFEKPLVVTFTNSTGMLAALTTEIARAEGDITNVNLGKVSIDNTAELRFMVSVRDLAHYENIVRHVKNTSGVLHVQSS